MKRTEVAEQKRPLGLFQLLSSARGGLTGVRWMGTRRSFCVVGASPQRSAGRREAGAASAAKTSSLLQAARG